MQSPTLRTQALVSLLALCVILVGFAGYDAIFAQGTPFSYHSAIFDVDWNYWSNPPHMITNPAGNVSAAQRAMTRPTNTTLAPRR